MLTARLERELVERINRMARHKDVSVNDLIDHAIGLVEMQNREADSLLDRVTVLEKNMLALYDLIAVFGERMDGKFSEASINEKERLEYLYALVEKKIVEPHLTQCLWPCQIATCRYHGYGSLSFC